MTSSPPSLLTPTSFVDGEAMNPVKLYARIFQLINYLLGLLNTSPQNRFFASVMSSATIAAGGNIDFTGWIVEDALSGWNSTGKFWRCNSAGTYAWRIAGKAGVPPPPQLVMFKNATPIFLGYNPAGGFNFGGDTLGGYIRLTVGDEISVQSQVAYNLQNDTPAHNNYLQLWQISYD